MSWPWEFFTEKELACPHCGECHMDDDFMVSLVAMREALGFPFIVTSAYRCPEYNQQVSSTGLFGPHTTGQAIDLLASGERAAQMHDRYLNFGFTRIGLRQHGPHEKRFVHLDTLKPDELPEGATRLWTYE